MAGGTWTTQNKVRPGVYVNFVTENQNLGSMGERGVVTMPLSLSWGSSKEMITIEAGDQLKELLGYDLASEQLLLIREVLKRAKTLLLYRLNTGVQAEATVGDLKLTAVNGGVRGNDLSVIIQPSIDDPALFEVKTLLEGSVADVQVVSSINELTANSWLSFSGTGSIVATAGVSLTGGDNGVVTNQDHMDYLSAAELQEFQVMAAPITDNTLKSLYSAFVKRLRENEGRKVHVVMENYPVADHEGVISVKNGVILSDSSVLNAAQSTAWVAGATAGANVNESLTYQAYDDAVDVDIRYSNSQIEEALQQGEFVFAANNGRAIVEQDINTFRSYTPVKGQPLSKNRVMRVLDGLANDYKRIFETYYIGKLDNNPDGRNLFKKECIHLTETYQGLNAIQNFNAQKDISVVKGNDSDSIYVEVHIQPVDSIEKIYMKVTVE